MNFAYKRGHIQIIKMCKCKKVLKVENNNLIVSNMQKRDN